MSDQIQQHYDKLVQGLKRLGASQQEAHTYAISQMNEAHTNGTSIAGLAEKRTQTEAAQRAAAVAAQPPISREDYLTRREAMSDLHDSDPRVQELQAERLRTGVPGQEGQQQLPPNITIAQNGSAIYQRQVNLNAPPTAPVQPIVGNPAPKQVTSNSPAPSKPTQQAHTGESASEGSG